MSLVFHLLLVPFLVADLLVWWGLQAWLVRNNLGQGMQWVWALWVSLMVLGSLYLFTQPIITGGNWGLIFGFAAVYLWHMFVLPILLILGLVWGVGAILGFVWRWVKGKGPASALEISSSRREFLRGVFSVPGLVALVGAGESCYQLHGFRVRRLELAFPQLPKELDGFTISHLSDLHVGLFTSEEALSRLVQITNGLGSDLVVMTGDLINLSLESLPLGIGVMKQLRARYGVYLCEGNHDLLEGPRQFRQQVKASGLNFLLDEAVTIVHQGSPIRLIGTHWTGGLNGSKDRGFTAQVFIDLIRRWLEPLKQEGAFHIVLSHHPHSWDSAMEAGIDLTLCGHTHGGQIMFDAQTGFGPLLFRYWSGLYRKHDQVLVVSNGVGAWFPLRIHAPAEIIHLTLRQG